MLLIPTGPRRAEFQSSLTRFTLWGKTPASLEPLPAVPAALPQLTLPAFRSLNKPITSFLSNHMIGRYHHNTGIVWGCDRMSLTGKVSKFDLLTRRTLWVLWALMGSPCIAKCAFLCWVTNNVSGYFSLQIEDPGLYIQTAPCSLGICFCVHSSATIIYTSYYHVVYIIQCLQDCVQVQLYTFELF